MMMRKWTDLPKKVRDELLGEFMLGIDPDALAIDPESDADFAGSLKELAENTLDQYEAEHPGVLDGFAADVDVADLLVKGYERSSKTTASKDPELIVAAQAGDIETVERLLARKRGIDIEIRDWAGLTPLMRAASGGHAQIMKLLLAKGSDPNAVSVSKHPRHETALMLAASAARVEAMQLLLRVGAKVDLVDVSGETALHHAASGYLAEGRLSDQRAAIELLLAHGADPRARSNLRRTPGNDARNKEIKRLLLDAAKAKGK